MTGQEVEYMQEGMRWLAKEGSIEAIGSTKEEAYAALLAIKSQIEPKGASDLTLENKAKITSTFDVAVDKITVFKLPKVTPSGMAFSAWYDSNPAVQGLGKTPTEAKVDLFKVIREKV